MTTDQYKWIGAIVVVIALDEQKLLMVRRTPTDDSDVDWQWVSETYEPKDGSMRVCAARGLHEELNLTVEPSECIFLKAEETDKLMGFYLYPLASTDVPSLNLQVEEVGETKWVSLDEYKAFEDPKHAESNRTVIPLIEKYLGG